MSRYALITVDAETFLTPCDTGDWVRFEDAEAAIKAEVEMCAMVCRDLYDSHFKGKDESALSIVDRAKLLAFWQAETAIRARGEK